MDWKNKKSLRIKTAKYQNSVMRAASSWVLNQGQKIWIIWKTVQFNPINLQESQRSNGWLNHLKFWTEDSQINMETILIDFWKW